MPKKETSEKTREWERERRERLNECFKSLSILLPSYDPSITSSKVEILQKAAAYISDLQKENRGFLKNGKEKSCWQQVCQFKKRVEGLLRRIQQLTTLLQDAGISIPPELPTKGQVASERPLKWSNRIRQEDTAALMEKAKRNAVDKKKKKKKKTPTRNRQNKVQVLVNQGQTPNSNCIPVNTSTKSIVQNITSQTKLGKAPREKKKVARKVNKQVPVKKCVAEKLPTVAQLLGLSLADIDATPGISPAEVSVPVPACGAPPATVAIVNAVRPQLQPSFIVIGGASHTHSTSGAPLPQPPCFVVKPTSQPTKVVKPGTFPPKQIPIVIASTASNFGGVVSQPTGRGNNIVAVSNSHLLTTPIMATGIQTCPTPTVLPSQGASLSTIILANGSIVPILPSQAQPPPPQATVLNANSATQFVVTPSNRFPAPVLPNQSVFVVQKNMDTTSSLGNTSAVKSNHTYPLCLPKPIKRQGIDSTKTTFANKVPIPALSSWNHQLSLTPAPCLSSSKSNNNRSGGNTDEKAGRKAASTTREVSRTTRCSTARANSNQKDKKKEPENSLLKVEGSEMQKIGGSHALVELQNIVQEAATQGVYCTNSRANSSTRLCRQSLSIVEVGVCNRQCSKSSSLCTSDKRRSKCKVILNSKRKHDVEGTSSENCKRVRNCIPTGVQSSPGVTETHSIICQNLNHITSVQAENSSVISNQGGTEKQNPSSKEKIIFGNDASIYVVASPQQKRGVEITQADISNNETEKTVSVSFVDVPKFHNSENSSNGEKNMIPAERSSACKSNHISASIEPTSVQKVHNESAHTTTNKGNIPEPLQERLLDCPDSKGNVDTPEEQIMKAKSVACNISENSPVKEGENEALQMYVTTDPANQQQHISCGVKKVPTCLPSYRHPETQNNVFSSQIEMNMHKPTADVQGKLNAGNQSSEPHMTNDDSQPSKESCADLHSDPKDTYSKQSIEIDPQGNKNLSSGNNGSCNGENKTLPQSYNNSLLDTSIVPALMPTSAYPTFATLSQNNTCSPENKLNKSNDTAEINTNNNTPLCISLQNNENNELSNDLFASLQVPPGGQQSESISPTAAFLLAFPLVSTSKVSEIIGDSQEDIGSDSMQGTSTLLQIGSIDPDVSHSESIISRSPNFRSQTIPKLPVNHQYDPVNKHSGKGSEIAHVLHNNQFAPSGTSEHPSVDLPAAMPQGMKATEKSWLLETSTAHAAQASCTDQHSSCSEAYSHDSMAPHKTVSIDLNAAPNKSLLSGNICDFHGTKEAENMSQEISKCSMTYRNENSSLSESQINTSMGIFNINHYITQSFESSQTTKKPCTSEPEEKLLTTHIPTNNFNSHSSRKQQDMAPNFLFEYKGVRNQTSVPVMPAGSSKHKSVSEQGTMTDNQPTEYRGTANSTAACSLASSSASSIASSIASSSPQVTGACSRPVCSQPAPSASPHTNTSSYFTDYTPTSHSGYPATQSLENFKYNMPTHSIPTSSSNFVLSWTTSSHMTPMEGTFNYGNVNGSQNLTSQNNSVLDRKDISSSAHDTAPVTSTQVCTQNKNLENHCILTSRNMQKIPNSFSGTALINNGNINATTDSQSHESYLEKHSGSSTQRNNMPSTANNGSNNDNQIKQQHDKQKQQQRRHQQQQQPPPPPPPHQQKQQPQQQQHQTTYRAPVNWMTTPDVRMSQQSLPSTSLAITLNTNSAAVVETPLTNKDFEIYNPGNSHSFFGNTISSNIPTFDTRTYSNNSFYGSHGISSHSNLYQSHHEGRQVHLDTCQNSGNNSILPKGNQVTHVESTPESQRTESQENDTFHMPWTQRKSSSLLVSDINASIFVSSSLPTLVGDLALGTSYPISVTDESHMNKGFFHSNCNFGDVEKKISIGQCENKSQANEKDKRVVPEEAQKSSGGQGGRVPNNGKSAGQDFRTQVSSGSFLSVSQLVDGARSCSGTSRGQADSPRRHSSANRQVMASNKPTTTHQQPREMQNVSNAATEEKANHNFASTDKQETGKPQQQNLSRSFSATEDSAALDRLERNIQKHTENKHTNENHSQCNARNVANITTPVSHNSSIFSVNFNALEVAQPQTSLSNGSSSWPAPAPAPAVAAKPQPEVKSTSHCKAPVSSYSAEALIGLNSTQNTERPNNIVQDPRSNKLITLPPPVVTERFCPPPPPPPPVSRALQMPPPFNAEGILPNNYFTNIDLQPSHQESSLNSTRHVGSSHQSNFLQPQHQNQQTFNNTFNYTAPQNTVGNTIGQTNSALYGPTDFMPNVGSSHTNHPVPPVSISNSFLPDLATNGPYSGSVISDTTNPFIFPPASIALSKVSCSNYSGKHSSTYSHAPVSSACHQSTGHSGSNSSGSSLTQNLSANEKGGTSTASIRCNRRINGSVNNASQHQMNTVAAGGSCSSNKHRGRKRVDLATPSAASSATGIGGLMDLGYLGVGPGISSPLLGDEGVYLNHAGSFLTSAPQHSGPPLYTGTAPSQSSFYPTPPPAGQSTAGHNAVPPPFPPCTTAQTAARMPQQQGSTASPSAANSSGTSLTNFNLSTIFPEINEKQVSSNSGGSKAIASALSLLPPTPHDNIHSHSATAVAAAALLAPSMPEYVPRPPASETTACLPPPPVPLHSNMSFNNILSSTASQVCRMQWP